MLALHFVGSRVNQPFDGLGKSGMELPSDNPSATLYPRMHGCAATTGYRGWRVALPVSRSWGKRAFSGNRVS
jgi:hypothetical protein